MADSLAKQGAMRSISSFATIFIISLVSWYYHCTHEGKSAFFVRWLFPYHLVWSKSLKLNFSLPTFLFRGKDFYYLLVEGPTSLFIKKLSHFMFVCSMRRIRDREENYLSFFLFLKSILLLFVVIHFNFFLKK